ncbi:PREDICTED: uncharacterized protein K02A2.6-like [Paramuricea clavata]|uniref:PREDICTED: uncharacterized protein K02A2.6-like n=1 Tax=Paramuricea clavata TaxID=317549 RepID=A0A6S7K315_PARCT|nr:PREDICTED: uncharacterized protein K02A2.6-like [Paramuricea clavata]
MADNYVCFFTQHAVPRAMTLPEIQQATVADSTLQILSNLITTGKWHLIDSLDVQSNPNVKVLDLKACEKIKTELTLNEHDGIILRGSQIVLPESLRLKAVQIAHEGHQGLVKTKQLLREKVWYPGIDKLAKHTVDTCLLCQANGPNSPQEPLRMTTLPPQPWHTVNIDFCGPFLGGSYLLVIIDAYSRFPEVEIVSSTSAKSTILKLERIFATHGIPKSHEFSLYLKELGIKHKPNSTLWPQGNGQAENFMKPLVKAVKSAHHENKDWKCEMFKFLLYYRATPHSTTGKSPSELLYNCKIQTKLPQVTVENYSSLHQEVKERDERLKKNQKEYADSKRRVKCADIKKSDLVLVRQPKSNKIITPDNGRSLESTEIMDEENYSSDEDVHEEHEEYDGLRQNDRPRQHNGQRQDDGPRYPARESQRVYSYGNNIYD